VTPPPPAITSYPDLAALSEGAAELWVQCASAAVAERGRFNVALTGGSTPHILYELLATASWSDRLDWASCHVFWGDERMVPADDPNSNFLLAQSTLLSHVAVPPAQIHRIRTEAGNEATAAARYESELRESFGLAFGNAHPFPAAPLEGGGGSLLAEIPRFDLVLLGLGADGHVASLFPGYPSLEETTPLVVGSPPGTLPPPVARVTLTLPVLNSALTVAFLVSGAEKTTALRRALAGDRALPAARVSPIDGALHWFVDRAAVGPE
jgi:6-phosphogluconolactonase